MAIIRRAYESVVDTKSGLGNIFGVGNRLLKFCLDYMDNRGGNGSN